MAEARVIAHHGEANYTVELLRVVQKIKAQIAGYRERLAEITIELGDAQVVVFEKEIQVGIKNVAVASAIDALRNCQKDCDSDRSDCETSCFFNTPVGPKRQGCLNACGGGWSACQQSCVDTNLPIISSASKESSKAKSELKQAEVLVDQLGSEQISLGKEVNRLDKILEREDNTSIWCVYLNEDFVLDDTVLALDAPADNQIKYFLSDPHTDPDGHEHYSDGMESPALYYDYSLLPGWYKWQPRYRIGTITVIDDDAGTCTVALSTATMTEEGKQLNLNHKSILANVPFEYMECDHIAFAAGDSVIVHFINKSWDQPEVIGFTDHPVPCPGYLETGWVKILPGTVPAEIIWIGDIYTDYMQRTAKQPYLDWAFIPGDKYKVRDYFDWTLSEIYVENHDRHDDYLHNHFATPGGLTGKFIRCLLSAKKDTSLFKAVFESPANYLLTYIIHRDTGYNYWFIKITDAGVFRAVISWNHPGTDILAYIQENYQSLTSAVIGKIESYLFACAKNVSGFSQIGSHTIEGTPIHYGWNPNTVGSAAVMTTIEKVYDGATLLHLRNRMYQMAIISGVSTTTTKEDEIGTPGIEDITVYYPGTSTTPGRMDAWYPKGLTEAWIDVDSDMPFYAYYLDNDVLFEIWFKHNATTAIPGGDYGNITDAEPDVCGGAGVSADFRFFTGSGSTDANGFYTKNSPGADVDLFTEASGGGTYYEMNWSTGATGGGQICLDENKNGASALEAHDCSGSYIADDIDGNCCGSHEPLTTTCGNATRTRKRYGGKTELIYSMLMLNHGSSNSATLSKMFYQSLPIATVSTIDWSNVIMEWDSPGTGHGRQGYPWGSWVGALFPNLFTVRVCTTTPPYNSSPCILAGTPTTGSSSEPATGPMIDIEHYLITGSDIITLLDNNYTDWDDVGDYEFVFVPPFANPHYEAEIWAHSLASGYTAAGDLISHAPVTDTGIDPGKIAYNLVPRGRQCGV